MTQSVGTKVVRNALSVFLGRVWFVVMGLALTPLLLGGLGKEVYGVWVVVDAVGRTVSLLDFGFGTSFVKHVAEYDARGDRAGVNAVFSAGLLFYTGVALLLASAALLAVEPLLTIFSIPEALRPEARMALRIAIAASGCANFMAVHQSIINGLQRMEITNAIMVGISLAFLVGCVIVVQGGYGVTGIAVSQLVTQVIGIAASMHFARRVEPSLRFSVEGIRQKGRHLFYFGLNVHLSNVAAIVNANFDKFLLSRWLGATQVAYYDVGTRAPATARSFAMVMLATLTPAASEVETRHGPEGFYALYERASRYVALVAFPLFIGVAVASRPLIEAWIGTGYEAAISVLAILCVGYLCSSFAGAVSPFAQGMGWPQCQRNAETLSLAVNVVASAGLLLQFGFLGAPIGTSIAMTVASAYYLYSFHQKLDRPLLPFLRRTALKPVACSILAAGAGAAAHELLALRVPSGRLGALLVLVAMGTAFASAYGLAILKSGHLDADESNQLLGYLSAAWRWHNKNEEDE